MLPFLLVLSEKITYIACWLIQYSNSEGGYVDCGERENEMAKVGPYGLPSTDNDIGRCTCESVMKIMTLVANSSNMHVAARDASIYTDGMDDGKRSTRPWEQGQPDAVPQKSPSSGRRPTPPRASPRSS